MLLATRIISDDCRCTLYEIVCLCALRPNPLNEKLSTLRKDRHLSRESGLALLHCLGGCTQTVLHVVDAVLLP